MTGDSFMRVKTSTTGLASLNSNEHTSFDDKQISPTAHDHHFPNEVTRNPNSLSCDNAGQHNESPPDQMTDPDASYHNITIEISSDTDSSHEQETPNDNDHALLPSAVDTSADHRNRVHFRSRVRITSGISRHHHQHFPSARASTDHGLISFSPDSSLSSSPSSSISAPLRSRSDDESNKPGWGPLGQRVAYLSNRPKKRRLTERKRKKYKGTQIEVNERTHLLRSFQPPYMEQGVVRGDREREVRLREIDLGFGTWPRRLLNRQWWWWQIEPIICCSWIEDSDLG